MAGAGAKLFVDGQKLFAADVNEYLMDQTVMRFADAAARDAAFGGVGEPILAEGMMCYLLDVGVIQVYNGTSWVYVASSSNPTGLVRVTSCTATFTGGTAGSVSDGVVTIGSANTAVTVSNAFSADFNNYKIIIENESSNAGNNHTMQLSGITTGYFTGGTFGTWGSTTVSGVGPASAATWVLTVGTTASTVTTMFIDIANPNIARRKTGRVSGVGSNNHNTYNLKNDSTSTATGFVLAKSGDAMTGGTIRVYGYNI